MIQGVVVKNLLKIPFEQFKAIEPLDHRNVLSYYDYYRDDDDQYEYIVMEYLQKGSLKDFIVANPKYYENELCLDKAFKDILEGVQYLNNKKIIHRDIKPGNILVTDDFTLKIADFGMSKKSTEAERSVSTLNAGTELFRAPIGIRAFGTIHRFMEYWYNNVVFKQYIPNKYLELIDKCLSCRYSINWILSQPPFTSSENTSDLFLDIDQISLKSKKVIVSIEIGWSWSSYAFIFLKGAELQNDINESDCSTNCQQCFKTLTTISLDKEDKVVKFGCDALSDHDHDNAIFSNYKMAIYDDVAGRKMVKASNSDKKASVNTLLVQTLLYFKKTSMASIHKQDKTIQPDDIQWVIPVPANWDLSAKLIIKNCAIKAGLCPPNHDNGHSVLICSESEANCYYALNKCQIPYIGVPDKTVLLLSNYDNDCQLHTLKVNGKNGLVETLPIPTNMVSTNVEQSFNSFLKDLLGVYSVTDAMDEQHYKELLKQFNQFIDDKNQVGDTDLFLPFCPKTILGIESAPFTEKRPSFHKPIEPSLLLPILIATSKGSVLLAMNRARSFKNNCNNNNNNTI
ncbi:hypothetical protein DFA_11445 [Cavenderia fasciculata]|uniref:Protein kinase domain-containing protein n=1 Tax=Cavenderia fasciculata TaxID=261658 RepID=F4QD03_CACFS|nr:uncharacterized protein DFA_11445 [Cavenderia fasciculata]EGG13684.1 hypothetical protein DFA_11445 [Cavenderia fasciculata]|eukprot:XP_004350388.1 hypothetical protein DFA_11445 [Cavenderia fasciculata]